jgi:hypothetical protein
LLEDVIKIITAIPDLHPTKAAEASLFLYAIHCGARSITCENILLSDIVSVEWTTDGKLRVVV